MHPFFKEKVQSLLAQNDGRILYAKRGGRNQLQEWDYREENEDHESLLEYAGTLKSHLLKT